MCGSLVGASVASVVACGTTTRGNNGGGDGGVGGDGGSNGSNGSNGSGSACASSKTKAEQTPLDIFIMLDHSASMQDSNKWTNVTSAITTFVQQPGLAGVSVGLQYFGVPPSTPPPTCSVFTCTVDGDCGDPACGPCFTAGGTGICTGALNSIGNTDSCVAADYATAAVPITALPGAASQITTSMSAHNPDGDSTPTEPALAGALQYAKSWASGHAGDAVVVVFATDGDPTGCGNTNDIPHAKADAMAAAASSPKVPTFVIGVGSDLANLNDIASGGGTGSAFLVDTGANATQQFLAAMNAIQHTALGCQYTIPLPMTGAPNYSEVNVNYTPGSGGAEVTIPKVANQAACPANGDGWYYDNEAMPTQIILCGATCTKVTADTSGEVDIALGCATVIQ